jgi:hypothetical protein
MAIDPAAPRSRRAILAGALGGAGALVAHALGRAAPVAAADGDSVQLGRGTTLTDNTANSPTLINSVAEPALGTQGAGTVGVWGKMTTSGIGTLGTSVSGTGAQGSSTTGAGVVGLTTGPGTGRSTGVLGSTGAGAGIADDLDETGVYGFADDSIGAAGVWGDTLQGIGVVGTGDWGVFGYGSVGVVGGVPAVATAVYGFAGDDDIITPTPGAGVVGRAGLGAVYGVVAAAAAPNQYALYVAGRLRLNGSGNRTTIASTAASKKVILAGVSTSSLIVATLQTSISGCYVRAVVPAAGSFTIYLSKAPGKTAAVGYIVAN